MKRATINDVALTAGVSTFTASRALRGKDHVAAATRDKVLKAAKELNYTASRSAAALASGRTNRIAMLARERLAGWFMGELFDGLYDELSRARYDLTYTEPAASRSVRNSLLGCQPIVTPTPSSYPDFPPPMRKPTRWPAWVCPSSR